MTSVNEETSAEDASRCYERPWTTGELEDEPIDDRDSVGTGFAVEGMLGRPRSAQVPLPNVRGSPSPDGDTLTAQGSTSKLSAVLEKRCILDC